MINKKILKLLNSESEEDAKIGATILYNQLGTKDFKELFENGKARGLLHGASSVILTNEYILYPVTGGYEVCSIPDYMNLDYWSGTHHIDLTNEL